MGEESSRAKILRRLEDRAERLAVHQLDLMAQIDAHFRAARHIMRRIGMLRPGRLRAGPRLTIGLRRAVLSELENEIGEIESQLELQEDTCRKMHRIIRWMQEGAADLQLIQLIAERLELNSRDACAAHI